MGPWLTVRRVEATPLQTAAATRASKKWAGTAVGGAEGRREGRRGAEGGAEGHREQREGYRGRRSAGSGFQLPTTQNSSGVRAAGRPPPDSGPRVGNVSARKLVGWFFAWRLSLASLRRPSPANAYPAST